MLWKHDLSFESNTLKWWKHLWNLEESLRKNLISANYYKPDDFPGQCNIFKRFYNFVNFFFTLQYMYFRKKALRKLSNESKKVNLNYFAFTNNIIKSDKIYNLFL